jgi:adenine-specific DNA methylase
MPDNGFQILMFTHQDAEVWSDLALILWAAGLRVTAAWTVATERESVGIKQGNYVQDTVLLVLRKRAGDERSDLADIFPEIQREVRRQVESM